MRSFWCQGSPLRATVVASLCLEGEEPTNLGYYLLQNLLGMCTI